MKYTITAVFVLSLSLTSISEAVSIPCRAPVSIEKLEGGATFNGSALNFCDDTETLPSGGFVNYDALDLTLAQFWGFSHANPTK